MLIIFGGAAFVDCMSVVQTKNSNSGVWRSESETRVFCLQIFPMKYIVWLEIILSFNGQGCLQSSAAAAAALVDYRWWRPIVWKPTDLALLQISRTIRHLIISHLSTILLIIYLQNSVLFQKLVPHMNCSCNLTTSTFSLKMIETLFHWWSTITFFNLY